MERAIAIDERMQITELVAAAGELQRLIEANASLPSCVQSSTGSTVSTTI
jgi:hypothetical protein